MNEEFQNKFRVAELTVLDLTHWIVSVRPAQVTVGSLVLSLRRDCSEVGDITAEEAGDLAIVFSRIEQLLKTAFGYSKINYLCLMMVDDHVHFHVLPRYSDPVQFGENVYEDASWPGPPDIAAAIGESGLELRVKDYLTTIAGKN